MTRATRRAQYSGPAAVGGDLPHGPCEIARRHRSHAGLGPGLGREPSFHSAASQLEGEVQATSVPGGSPIPWVAYGTAPNDKGRNRDGARFPASLPRFAAESERRMWFDPRGRPGLFGQDECRGTPPGSRHSPVTRGASLEIEPDSRGPYRRCPCA
jgi:hypothetical protein